MTLPLSKLIDVDDFDTPELAPYLQEIDAMESLRGGAGAAQRDQGALFACTGLRPSGACPLLRW